MRLWTLHPQYLDAQGLVVLWREALLAHSCRLG
ncbi:MAG: pyrimidine dimer DNA glycosylase/endonuclease V [Sulfuricella sp.]